MDKNKLIMEMSTNTELRFNNPYYKNIFNTLCHSEVKEKELAELIALMCKSIQDSNEMIIKYFAKYGNID